jgi:uncharacterized surface anchored protein
MRSAARLFVAVALASAMLAGGTGPSLAGDPSATGATLAAAGGPAVGVPLKVTGPIGETTVFTDANGAWTLYGLPPGDYQIVPLDDPSAAVTVFTITGNATSPVILPALQLR